MNRKFPFIPLILGMAIFLSLLTALHVSNVWQKDNFDMLIVQEDDTPLSSIIRKKFLSLIKKEIANLKAFSLNNLCKRLETVDFIVSLEIKQHLWGKDSLVVRVVTPVARLLVSDQEKTTLYTVSLTGKITQDLGLDLPFLSNEDKAWPIENGVIADSRIILWLKFINQTKNNTKGSSDLYALLSELIFFPNHTGLRWKGFRSQILLPLLPKEKLLVKIEATLHYLVKKSFYPAKIDLTSENAIVYP